jgi:hypothetical protein
MFWRIRYVLPVLIWLDRAFQPCAVWRGWDDLFDRIVEWTIPEDAK